MFAEAPYLLGIRTLREFLPEHPTFPFTLPFVPDLQLRFRTPVTFFVGENGSGKSTLLEALADLNRLPVSGGGRNELAGHHGPEEESALARVLRPSFRLRPHDGFFLRAEFAAHFATLLDQRRDDPDFFEDPYASFGGRSLHAQSHGEGFLAILQGRLHEGIYLLDEPESALSPERQLSLLALIHQLASEGRTQFFIATHSPILLTFPGAQILSFDGGTLRETTLEETSHYRITRGILEAPERYWRHLSEH